MKKKLLFTTIALVICLITFGCTPEIAPPDNTEEIQVELPDWLSGSWANIETWEINSFTNDGDIYLPCTGSSSITVIKQYSNVDSYIILGTWRDNGQDKPVMAEFIRANEERMILSVRLENENDYRYNLIKSDKLINTETIPTIPSSLIGSWKASSGAIYNDLLITADNMTFSVYGNVNFENNNQLEINLQQDLSAGGKIRYFKQGANSLEMIIELNRANINVRVWINIVKDYGNFISMQYSTTHNNSLRAMGTLNYYVSSV